MGLASYNSVAFFGPQGSGKTLGMIKLAIKLACKRKRGIVANLNLSREGFYNYGVKFKLDWLKYIAEDEGQIVSLTSDYDMDLLFRYPYKIVIFDEAGILMNSRSWNSNNKSILRSINQLRKNYCTFLWSAQFQSMTDKMLREVAERCAWCQGVSFFNPDSQTDHLVWEDINFFQADKFWTWVDNPEMRLKPITTFLRRSDRWYGPIGKSHKLAFNCYNSHDLIGNKTANPLQPIFLPKRYRCDLGKGYYLSKLISGKDPLTRLEVIIKYPTETETIASLAGEFEGFPRVDYPKRIVTNKKIPYGEFEIEKKLPPFYGWKSYPNSSLKVKSSSNHSYSRSIHPNVLSVINS